MPAQGDAYVVGPTSVADAAFLDLRPAAGEEVVVHNIYVRPSFAVEFYWSDGFDEIMFDSDTVAGARFNHNFHCTNARWVRVKNVSASTIFLGADGIYTKGS